MTLPNRLFFYSLMSEEWIPCEMKDIEGLKEIGYIVCEADMIPTKKCHEELFNASFQRFLDEAQDFPAMERTQYKPFN